MTKLAFAFLVAALCVYAFLKESTPADLGSKSKEGEFPPICQIIAQVHRLGPDKDRKASTTLQRLMANSPAITEIYSKQISHEGSLRFCLMGKDQTEMKNAFEELRSALKSADAGGDVDLSFYKEGFGAPPALKLLSPKGGVEFVYLVESPMQWSLQNFPENLFASAELQFHLSPVNEPVHPDGPYLTSSLRLTEAPKVLNGEHSLSFRIAKERGNDFATESFRVKGVLTAELHASECEPANRCYAQPIRMESEASPPVSAKSGKSCAYPGSKSSYEHGQLACAHPAKDGKFVMAKETDEECILQVICLDGRWENQAP